MDNIHLQSSNVIGPLLAESQSHLMIEDVHHPPIVIFRTLVFGSNGSRVSFLSPPETCVWCCCGAGLEDQAGVTNTG